VQPGLVGVVEEAHVVLLVLVAELRVTLAEFALVAAALLVAVELHDGALADDLDHGAFVEDVEYLELLLEVVEELGDEQHDHLLVLDQGVNHLLPVFVLVVVDEHGLHLAKVAALLLVALDELVLQELDLGFHLVGLEDDGVVHPAFGLELADLGVEELRVVVDVDQLVLGAYVGRTDRELLLDRDHLVLHGEVFDQRLVDLALAQVVYQRVDHLDFKLEVVFGLVVLQLLEVAACVDLAGQVVDLAHLSGLDLELVVLALADDQTLHVVFQSLVLVVEEVLLEGETLVLDYFVVVVDLVVLLHPDSVLALRDHQVFEVVALHLTFEAPLLFVLGHFVLNLVVRGWGLLINRCLGRQRRDSKALEGVLFVHVHVVDDV